MKNYLFNIFQAMRIQSMEVVISAAVQRARVRLIKLEAFTAKGNTGS